MDNKCFEKLFRAFKAGDQAAKDALVEANLGLVGSVVGRFCGALEDRDDLFQVGCVGLLKALDRFDPQMGFRFSTYAFHTILGEIRRYLRDTSPVRIPRTLKERSVKVRAFQQSLSQTLEREPTINEISEAMRLDESAVIEALEASRAPISLSEPIAAHDAGSATLADRVAAPATDQTERLSLLVAMGALSALERRVLEFRYHDEFTQQEAATLLGISQSQVSRVERAAIVRLRNLLQ